MRMWVPAGERGEGPEDAEKEKWDAGRRGMVVESELDGRVAMEAGETKLESCKKRWAMAGWIVVVNVSEFGKGQVCPTSPSDLICCARL
jgi:hypothetical protein